MKLDLGYAVWIRVGLQPVTCALSRQCSLMGPKGWDVLRTIVVHQMPQIRRFVQEALQEYNRGRR